MKKVIIFLLIIISVPLTFNSCKDAIDLKELIETDVKAHNNPKHFLTVETTAGGAVSPAGTVEIVDELPTSLTATADEGYAFKGWEFLTGEKSASLSSAVTESGNILTVDGADVIIRAVFVRQPVVISHYPKDEDVARNMPVRIVFSKIIDAGTITSSTIQVFDNLSGHQIEGEFEINGSELLFFAKDSSLEQTGEGLYLWEPNRHYQVYIRTNVLDSDGIPLIEEISWFFSTGTDVDNTPPDIDFFIIESPLGSTTHTNTPDIELSFDAEDESRIPIRAVKYWNLGQSEPDDPYLLDVVADEETGKIAFSVPDGTDGPKQVNFKVYDMSNNFSETTATITLDRVSPTLDTQALLDPDAGPHDADGFANTRDMSFQLSGTDDQAFGSLGWVIDNPEGTITWVDYTTAPVDFVLPDSDGTHTVYFAVRDEAGNISGQNQESITLDREGPTGTVEVKGGADWICGADQYAAISLTRSDLSLGLGEIEIAVQADGDGWTTGDLSVTRAWTTELNDLDLLPVSEIHESGDEVTVSVKLIDVFDHERIITKTIGLDFDAPTVSTFYIKSLDNLSSGRTDYCKAPSKPYVQLVFTIADTGGSGPGDYRWDTDESGVDWSGWIENSAASPIRKVLLEGKYGNRYAYLEVKDRAGNVSATYNDYILNYYHAYFSLYSIYVSDDSDSGAGEIYWDFSMQYRAVNGGAITNYNYIFTRPDGQGVSVTSPGGFYLSGIAQVSGERRTLHWYRSSPPYSFRIVGYLVDDDGATGDDWSDGNQYEVRTGSYFRKIHDVSVTGAPAGTMQFSGDDNYY